jgi:hypothetical protein
VGSGIRNRPAGRRTLRQARAVKLAARNDAIGTLRLP